MEYENKHDFASKGVAGTALGLGAGALGVELLRGGLGGLFGGTAGVNCGCNEDHVVNRYEASQAARIAELETEVKLRDANTFTMGEMNKFRNYVDARFSSIESQICQQSVVNAQMTANISCMQNSIATLMGLTKTVIPISNVCPAPMEKYNSWTAPTTTT